MDLHIEILPYRKIEVISKGWFFRYCERSDAINKHRTFTALQNLPISIDLDSHGQD
jgi:hypothetical protein